MMGFRRRPPATDDNALVRRATIRIAALTAGAVAVVVAAVMSLAVYLTIREQHMDAARIVREAAMNAEDVTDPPNGVALLVARPGRPTEASPNVPPELTSLDPASLPAGSSQYTVHDDHSYEIYVNDRADGERVVAALDLRYRARESERLVGSLLPAGLLGIAAAGLVGWLLSRRAVRPLGDALALQRRFVADASHELRTPLAILHTRAQLLRRRVAPDSELTPHLDRLIEDSRAMAEIVNDLLLSAELTHRPTAHDRVDLGALAEAVVRSFQPLAQRHSVSLTAAVVGEDLAVAGVPAALRRAVSALVDNALGHTEAEDTITVRVQRREGFVELAVIDTGEGLDPDRAADLAKRFARGDAAPGQGRRFGLGLALVREVVLAHRGTLTMSGSPGEGATVTISLPAAPV